MKEIFNYCSQVRRYGPSEGKCLVELEEGDDVDEVIKDYTKPREWFAQKYSNPQKFAEFKRVHNDGSITTYTGKLILFNTFREYLD